MRVSGPFRSWSCAVLFNAVVFLIAACARTSEPPLATESENPNRASGGGQVAEAFYLLQKAHINSSGWPDDYRQYSVFVCNPSLNQTFVDKIRADVPGAICLASSSCMDVPIGVYDGVPYFDALTAAFPEDLCIRDLLTDELVRVERTADDFPDVPAFVLSRESADVLAAFHRDVTMSVTWDGLYLDRCVQSFPQGRKNSIAAITTSFDIDGDGIADTFDDLDAQYALWRPYYTVELRAALGDQAILLANSGGPLLDDALNGICLERVGDRFDRDDAEGWILSQWEVAPEPRMSILFAFSDDDFGQSKRLARKLSGASLADLRP